MSKAILVLDEMPKDCVRCKFAQWSVPDEKWVCIAKEEYGEPPWEIYDYDEALESPEPGPNPEWCPIKELPSCRYIPAEREHDYNSGYNDGYNDCLWDIEEQYELGYRGIR